jgi:hypothetical protein
VIRSARSDASNGHGMGLEDLARKIALEVPDANVPDDFDVWK